ncbi:hypothetical protein [Rhodopila sp.]|uniref:hypothetical protein n=1 Tax=Rhodopila sp. TaxID=2480087 RepID=UPI003D0A72C9
MPLPLCFAVEVFGASLDTLLFDPGTTDLPVAPGLVGFVAPGLVGAVVIVWLLP